MGLLISAVDAAKSKAALSGRTHLTKSGARATINRLPLVALTLRAIGR